MQFLQLSKVTLFELFLMENVPHLIELPLEKKTKMNFFL